MIETTSSRYSEQTGGFPKHERKILPAIACSICDAGYTPSPAHQNLLQAPPMVLEAAFMSMCHFCFRCRRPACPACWDAVHGVCGACVQEARLPFRVDVAPLNGVIFPPSPVHQLHPAEEHITSQLLVCVRPGRFQAGPSLSTDSLKTLSAAPPKDQLAKEKTKGQSASPPQVSGIAPAPQVQNGDGPKKSRPASQVQDDDELEEPGAVLRFLKIVERVVTVILLIILLAIVVMVILAEVSATANTQIIGLFHIDIRYEIAYLVSLIRQLHW